MKLKHDSEAIVSALGIVVVLAILLGGFISPDDEDCIAAITETVAGAEVTESLPVLLEVCDSTSYTPLVAIAAVGAIVASYNVADARVRSAAGEGKWAPPKGPPAPSPPSTPSSAEVPPPPGA